MSDEETHETHEEVVNTLDKQTHEEVETPREEAIIAENLIIPESIIETRETREDNLNTLDFGLDNLKIF